MRPPESGLIHQEEYQPKSPIYSWRKLYGLLPSIRFDSVRWLPLSENCFLRSLNGDIADI